MTISKRRMFLKLLRLWARSIIKHGWYLPDTPEITVDEVNDRLNSNNLPLLLDHRDEKEFYGTGEYK
ncbi:MAG: hypothetical protein ACFFC7_25330, partial [Candidatus Hermodarchaeota archaeon]